MTYKRGNYYEGDWVDGQMYGNGTFKWSNGKSYSGNIKLSQASTNKANATVSAGTIIAGNNTTKASGNTEDSMERES
jgi:hypothetical protein